MKTTPTRERLIQSMGSALQRHGLHGVGLSEILEDAGAPKGGLYHHFPGGKAELAVAAIEAQVAAICSQLDHLLPAAPDLVSALEHWNARAQQQLADSSFQLGCPLATVALESNPDDVAIRKALADGFAAIRARLAAALEARGNVPNAAGLAALIVAAYEGALMQARVAGSVAPMETMSATLFPLLRAQLNQNGD